MEDEIKIAYDWLYNMFYDKQYSLKEISEIMVAYNKEMASVLNEIKYYGG